MEAFWIGLCIWIAGALIKGGLMIVADAIRGRYVPGRTWAEIFHREGWNPNELN